MKSRFSSALRAVTRLLEDAGLESMLIGGQAAIYHGSERTTRDIDLTVWVEDTAIRSLIARARAEGFETLQQDPLGSALARRLLILMHKESGIQIDLMIAGTPFENEALGRAISARVAGVRMRVIRPDDLLVYKLLASRARDIEDAACIIEKGMERLDLRRLRAILTELDTALGRDDLAATLDRLLAEQRSHTD